VYPAVIEPVIEKTQIKICAIIRSNHKKVQYMFLPDNISIYLRGFNVNYSLNEPFSI